VLGYEHVWETIAWVISFLEWNVDATCGLENASSPLIVRRRLTTSEFGRGFEQWFDAV
jgi:hypothetical protein